MITLGRKKKTEDNSEAQMLLRQLLEAKADLDHARQKFAYVTEPEMVASSIYEMHAGQARYEHLLRKVREADIRVDQWGS